MINQIQSSYDVVIVGAGHNGLVAAIYLSMAGKKVLMLEKNDYIGGATTSQKVFSDYDAYLSRYSYLVSLFPYQIVQELGLDLQLLRRRIASYTPYHQNNSVQSLLLSNESEATSKDSIISLGYGEKEWQGYQCLQQRQIALAELVWDSFLLPLQSKNDWEKQFARHQCQDLWKDFIAEPIGKVIEQSVESDILRGVLLTDAKIGAYTHAHDPSLLQNRTFLYHIVGNKTGEWRVPAGGMGNVAQQLIQKAVQHGTEIITHANIKEIHFGNNQAHSLSFEHEGQPYEVKTDYILSNASEQILATLAGKTPPILHKEDEGTAFKINMLLKKLPALKDKNIAPTDAFAGTFHINQSYTQQAETFKAAQAGKLADTLAGEIYCHTLTDGSILSEELRREGYQTLTLFGLDLPYSLFKQDNEGLKKQVVNKYITGINQYLDEPLEECLAKDLSGNWCVEAKSTLDIEKDLGMPMGNIFHKALSWFYADNDGDINQWGVETPYPNVYICGSSAKRGGAVSGIAGRNAAMKILK